MAERKVFLWGVPLGLNGSLCFSSSFHGLVNCWKQSTVLHEFLSVRQQTVSLFLTETQVQFSINLKTGFCFCSFIPLWACEELWIGRFMIGIIPFFVVVFFKAFLWNIFITDIVRLADLKVFWRLQVEKKNWEWTLRNWKCMKVGNWEDGVKYGLGERVERVTLKRRKEQYVELKRRPKESRNGGRGFWVRWHFQPKSGWWCFHSNQT